MKNLIIGILAVALIGAGLYIFMTKKGHNTESIINTVYAVQLHVDCSSLESSLIGSALTVAVMNNGDDLHKNVEVRITAYDEEGGILKQKNTKFMRDLEPKGELSKIVKLPGKTAKCDCVILDSEKVESEE